MKHTEKQPLTEQIIAHELEHHAGGRSAVNRALFLAKKDEIDAAIKAGLNSKIIWKTLRNNNVYIGGYESFRRYVRRYINPSNDCEDKTKKTDCTKQPDQSTAKFHTAHLPKQTVPTTQTEGFVFSPDDDIDSLI